MPAQPSSPLSASRHRGRDCCADAAAKASDFSEPWKSDDRALVIDAYEYNSIDWAELATDKRIVGFINKASDGLPPPYFCFGDEIEVRLLQDAVEDAMR